MDLVIMFVGLIAGTFGAVVFIYKVTEKSDG